MNHIKTFFLPFICLWVFIPYGISQNEHSDKKKLSIKPFYAVEANFGISATNEIKYSVKYYGSHYFLEIEDDDAKFSYKTLVYGANFLGGVELAHYLKIGLGLGYLYYKQSDKTLPYTHSLFSSFPINFPDHITTHGIPLFVYIRSDFWDNKTSPYIDFKIGNNFLVTKEAVTLTDREGRLVCNDYGKFRLKNGLFMASNIGIAFKIKPKGTLNLSLGYRYVSRDHDLMKEIIDYFEKKITYRKTGYTRVDHQFLFNIGVSF